MVVGFVDSLEAVDPLDVEDDPGDSLDVEVVSLEAVDSLDVVSSVVVVPSAVVVSSGEVPSSILWVNE